MRFRIRGPTGQSVISLGDDATVGDLNTAISKGTSLSTFDIKIGYPPRTLDLDHVTTGKRLSDLGIKLNGEQLLVTSRESTPAKQFNHDAQQRGPAATNQPKPQPQATSSKQAALSRDAAGPSSSSFSFGDLGPASSAASSTKPTTSSAARKPAAADLSLSRKSNVGTLNDPPEIVLPEHGGILVLRIMPDDNSCLFRA